MDDKALTVFESNNITITAEERDTFVRSISTQNPTEPELKLYFYDCARRGIHPLDKLLYFTKRKGKYTPITSIDYMRMRAESSGAYAGSDDAVFDDGDDKYPYSATITVYKMVGNTRCPFTATARWEEYSPDLSQDFAFMWKKMPKTMLAKCAEALALRKAFPGVLHGLYIKEEMDQAGIIDGEVVATKSIPVTESTDVKRVTVPKFATPIATSPTQTVEPKPAAAASAPETFPVIEPTKTGDFVGKHEELQAQRPKVIIRIRKEGDGKVVELEKNASDKVDAKFSDWFFKAFVGKGNVFESIYHLLGSRAQKDNFGHIGAHFEVKTHSLSGLTYEQAEALVAYAYAQAGDDIGRIDPKYYSDKIEKVAGDVPIEVDVATVPEIPYDTELKYANVMLAWGEAFLAVDDKGAINLNGAIMDAWGVDSPKALTQAQMHKLMLVIEAKRKGNLTADEVVAYLKAD